MKLPKLLDCTLRDGGYINNWDFSPHFGEALYRAVSQSGIDFIEVGFFEPGQENGLPWTNLSKKDLKRLSDRVTEGCELAVMINYGSVSIDAVPPVSDYPAQMIRVATPKNKAKEGTEFAAELSKLGYKTTINYMGVSNYTNEEILSLIDLMNEFGEQIDYFYVADSFGSLLPKRTREIFTTLRFGTKAKLGFHPHNNLQMAFANCLEAIDAGVDIIDSSVFGMGRGAGNLFTDAILAYFEQQEPERFQLLPVLQFADLYMEEMKKSYNWGYSLPQLLSGIMSCHPNYPTNLLKEKAYTADDIYRILQFLPETEKARFSQGLLKEIKSEHSSALSEQNTAKINPQFIEVADLTDRKALIVCGGGTVAREQSSIADFIQRESPDVFTVNNPAAPVPTDGVIFCNRRRLLQHGHKADKISSVILSPEIHESAELDFDLLNVSRINPSQLLKAHSLEITAVPTNSAIVSVLGLVQIGYKQIFISGLDGYGSDQNYYYNESDQLLGTEEKEAENQKISEEVELMKSFQERLDFEVTSITKSRFFKNPEA